MAANENEFRQPVSVDDAPAGSVCEWCGKPAVRQLIAQGGKHHEIDGCKGWIYYLLAQTTFSNGQQITQ